MIQLIPRGEGNFSRIFQRKRTIAICMGMWVQIPLRLKIVLDGLTEIRISYPLTKSSPAMVASWGLGKPLSYFL